MNCREHVGHVRMGSGGQFLNGSSVASRSVGALGFGGTGGLGRDDRLYRRGLRRGRWSGARTRARCARGRGRSSASVSPPSTNRATMSSGVGDIVDGDRDGRRADPLAADDHRRAGRVGHQRELELSGFGVGSQRRRRRSARPPLGRSLRGAAARPREHRDRDRDQRRRRHDLHRAPPAPPGRRPPPRSPARGWRLLADGGDRHAGRWRRCAARDRRRRSASPTAALRVRGPPYRLGGESPASLMIRRDRIVTRLLHAQLDRHAGHRRRRLRHVARALRRHHERDVRGERARELGRVRRTDPPAPSRDSAG